MIIAGAIIGQVCCHLPNCMLLQAFLLSMLSFSFLRSVIMSHLVPKKNRKVHGTQSINLCLKYTFYTSICKKKIFFLWLKEIRVQTQMRCLELIK